MIAGDSSEPRQVSAKQGLGPQHSPHCGTFFYSVTFSTFSEPQAQQAADLNVVCSQPLAARWISVHFSNILTPESQWRRTRSDLSVLFFCSAFLGLGVSWI